jgi:hypothetical protein
MWSLATNNPGKRIFEWVRFILRKDSIGKASKAKEKHRKRIFSLEKTAENSPGILCFWQILT